MLIGAHGEDQKDDEKWGRAMKTREDCKVLLDEILGTFTPDEIFSSTDVRGMTIALSMANQTGDWTRLYQLLEKYKKPPIIRFLRRARNYLTSILKNVNMVV